MHEESIPSPTIELDLGRGYIAVIDADDLSKVSNFKWAANVPKNRNTVYAYAYLRGSSNGRGSKTTKVYLHRLIMDAPPGISVDHINQDGLDCRKVNLRLATSTQQMGNRAKYGKHPYKGIRCKVLLRGVVWAYQSMVRGKKVNGPWRNTPEEAARDYDDFARQYFGEFARLNFPREGEQGI